MPHEVLTGTTGVGKLKKDVGVESRNVSIGVCTFRRPTLMRTLESIADQTGIEGVSLRVIVADNDDEALLGNDLAEFAKARSLRLRYVHAPARNISIARNACLENADDDVLVFIDDDEIADPDWLSQLLASADATDAGVVFGPSVAVFPRNAPEWMVTNDFHSNVPTTHKGIVETGYSSNVLLNMRFPAVRAQRFHPAYGRTGGEDVDFFFRLHRKGVPMHITMSAIVREPVDPKRLSATWILKRRYRSGQIYGHCAMTGEPPRGITPRLFLMVRSLAKSGYCVARAGLPPFKRGPTIFWIMRASFHAGVIFGAMARPRSAFYGMETAQ